MKKRNQSNMVESGIGAEASRDRVSEGLLEEVAVGTAGPEGPREA